MTDIWLKFGMKREGEYIDVFLLTSLNDGQFIFSDKDYF